MIDFKLTYKRDMVPRNLKRLRKELVEFPEEILEKFIELTPKDTGYARKNTRLVGKKKIIANYEYASVLDKGRRRTIRGYRGSEQAPQGMTQPFEQWVRAKVRKIFGK
jgi:hypothetical protein